MTSQVDICNGALNQIGASTIVSLSDDSKNARMLNQRYEMVRDRVFREHPWNCLLKRATLPADTATPEYEYSYQYTLPADCIRVLKTFQMQDDVDFKVEGRKILTDAETVKILYVARITDTTQYDTSLNETLTAALAADIAYGITGSTTIIQIMEQRYKEKLKDARFADATEGMPDTLDADSPFIASRF
tara:strand:- start:3520 stop:4086 length:567 start_codon:yes stop_codon:yes gene_type:complete